MRAMDIPASVTSSERRALTLVASALGGRKARARQYNRPPEEKRSMPTRRALLTSTAAAAAAPVLAPRVTRAEARKAVLTIALPSTPETIDPHQFRSVLSGSIINLMGEGLLTRDPQTMEIKPLLAESVKNVNPNTWEIK